MKKQFKKLGQGISEYVLVVTLVAAGVIVGGPYVINSWNAYLRGWDVSMRESMTEPMLQAGADELDPNFDCPDPCPDYTEHGCEVAGCDVYSQYITQNCPFDCDPNGSSFCQEDSGCCDESELLVATNSNIVPVGTMFCGGQSSDVPAKVYLNGVGADIPASCDDENNALYVAQCGLNYLAYECVEREECNWRCAGGDTPNVQPDDAYDDNDNYGICPGDNDPGTLPSSNLPYRYVSACTNTRKCEVLCANGTVPQGTAPNYQSCNCVDDNMDLTLISPMFGDDYYACICSAGFFDFEGRCMDDLECKAYPVEDNQSYYDCVNDAYYSETLIKYCTGNCDSRDAKLTICCRPSAGTTNWQIPAIYAITENPDALDGGGFELVATKDMPKCTSSNDSAWMTFQEYGGQDDTGGDAGRSTLSTFCSSEIDYTDNQYGTLKLLPDCRAVSDNRNWDFDDHTDGHLECYGSEEALTEFCTGNCSSDDGKVIICCNKCPVGYRYNSTLNACTHSDQGECSSTSGMGIRTCISSDCDDKPECTNFLGDCPGTGYFLTYYDACKYRGYYEGECNNDPECMWRRRSTWPDP